MNISATIKEKIQSYKPGEAFSSGYFFELGSRQAVDTTLSRLAKAGYIKRVIPGIYSRPKKNKYIGEVAPDVYQVISVLAKENGETIQLQGVEAARYFKLTTQVPNEIIYYTSGQTRALNIGALTVKLKHAGPSKLIYAGTKIGVAITALRFLGKEHVGLSEINKIKEGLSIKEFEMLLSAKMPIWLSAIFRKYKEQHA